MTSEPLASSRHTSLVIALVAIAVAVAAAVAVIAIGTHRQASSSATGVSPLAIGEAVFQSGIGPDGRPVPRSESQGPTGGGMMGGGMMRLSCASCHGTDGHGLTTQQFTSPDITYSNLTDPQGMLMPDGTRDVTYTDAGLRRTITTGVDPEGSQLQWPMPQWQLTDQEWTGLLAYLKTLH
ncbi:MAG TPA: cytochrome c [Thermoleophilia bacterium]|nr:cytochrome c [Thermoleophilia bacterium]